MAPQERRRLNQKVGALAFGKLKLDEEIYRTIVASIDPKSGGHLTRCDDEHANLVKMHLESMLRSGATGISTTQVNSGQHRFIARLMDYLGWSWNDTARFCFRQTGKKNTRLCDARDLSRVIIGMIRTIDDRIEKGKIKLLPQELEEYRKHTRLHRAAEWVSH